MVAYFDDGPLCVVCEVDTDFIEPHVRRPAEEVLPIFADALGLAAPPTIRWFVPERHPAASLARSQGYLGERRPGPSYHPGDTLRGFVHTTDRNTVWLNYGELRSTEDALHGLAHELAHLGQLHFERKQVGDVEWRERDADDFADRMLDLWMDVA